MEPKFNFYDFVGYIVPGAIALALLYWLATAFFALKLDFEITSVGKSILFLIASYALGHLVQALGNTVESREVKKWGGWFSEQFLQNTNSHYSSEFKTLLIRFACEVFTLPPYPQSDDKLVQMKSRQEIFKLCYSLIVQVEVAQHAEIFNGVYSLYRGLLSVSYIGITVSALIVIKGLAWLAIQSSTIRLPRGAFFSYKELQLAFGIAALIFFVASIPTLRSRFKRFGMHFADSVYRSFYVWCSHKHLEQQIDSNNE